MNYFFEIYKAAATLNDELLKQLKDKGICLDESNLGRYEESAAFVLASQNNHKAVELLRKHGASVNDIARGYAVAGNIQKAEFYRVKYGASVDHIVRGLAMAATKQHSHNIAYLQQPLNFRKKQISTKIIDQSIPFDSHGNVLGATEKKSELEFSFDIEKKHCFNIEKKYSTKKNVASKKLTVVKNIQARYIPSEVKFDDQVLNDKTLNQDAADAFAFNAEDTFDEAYYDDSYESEIMGLPDETYYDENQIVSLPPPPVSENAMRHAEAAVVKADPLQPSSTKIDCFKELEKYRSRHGASLNAIAYGFALAGNLEMVNKLFTRCNISPSIIAKGLAIHGKHHAEIEFYREKGASVNSIVYGYVINGNLEKAEEYCNKYEGNRIYIVQAYAALGQKEKADEYRKKHNISFLEAVYDAARSGHTKIVEAYHAEFKEMPANIQAQLNNDLTYATAIGYAAGNHFHEVVKFLADKELSLIQVLVNKVTQKFAEIGNMRAVKYFEEKYCIAPEPICTGLILGMHYKEASSYATKCATELKFYYENVAINHNTDKLMMKFDKVLHDSLNRYENYEKWRLYTQSNKRKTSINNIYNFLGTDAASLLKNSNLSSTEKLRMMIALVKYEHNETMKDHQKHSCLHFFTTPDLIKALDKALATLPRELVEKVEPASKEELEAKIKQIIPDGKREVEDRPRTSPKL